MNLHDILLQDISTALIDQNIQSSHKLPPKLIYNDYTSGSNLLTNLQKELTTCQEFYFAIAFITQSGITALKETLRELVQKQIPGYILTTNYLNFTQPQALADLLQFTNLRLRIYTQDNFHIKGYIFKHEGYTSAIIGSSNLTQTALKLNKEWNLQISSLANGALIKTISIEFHKLWQEAQPVTSEWLSNYQKVYKQFHAYQEQTKQNFTLTTFKPNKMQIEALASLQKIQQQNKRKALLISATGTGKTYLSAFAVQEFKPRRLLFLAHREQILKQANHTFKQIMPNLCTGFLTGTQKDITAPYLFSTITMMSKPAIYEQFIPTHFDYIIVDETHRAGAKSYQTILNYFKPQFLLGMTATPERTDGFDIYQLFDHNIAYEIRLKQAMEENMLCPFHYFGITDICINDREIDDKTAFNDLVTDERVNYIIKQAQFYGYSGNRVRGLIFCSNIHEAETLSAKFNTQGFNTIALCGKHTQEKRDMATAKLMQDKRQNGLDYIFTVDIFNEGIDIPAINQIIMLRPTKSAIVFVQQMGRGLRKYPHKDFVVILDFIGNYQNNFMIPIALSGDTSYNKDTIRHYVAEGNRFLPGSSTINFDEISRQKIYAAIDSAKLSDTALLKNAYLTLKQKIGHIPTLTDFSKFSSIDILKYFDKFGSYHTFLQKYEPAYTVSLSPIQIEMLLFICHRFAKGKRSYELLILKQLLTNPHNSLSSLLANLSPLTKLSIIRNLTNQFTISNEQPKYANCIFIQEINEQYTISNLFATALKSTQFKQILTELIDFALARYQKYYLQTYKKTNLVLYQKYTYEEVCYLLNWPNKINPNAMAGYFYEKTTHTMPVFINYINPKQKRVDYPNEFLANNLITAYSKANRKLDSSDAKHIYNSKEEQNTLYLFIRKPNKDKEAKEFYFLGEITATGTPAYEPKYKGFKIVYQLANPVRDDIFDYLLS